MSNGIVFYRARGGVDFTFRFVWIQADQTWRVYIQHQPGYGSRDAGAHATHRLGLSSRPYVCWTDRLATYADARSVAALWADATIRYIATGTFEPPSGPRNVRDQSAYAQVSEQRLRTALAEGIANPQPAPPTNPNTSSRTGPIRRLLERIG